ncbi:MAG TPA: PAS domain-containing protein, partial [Longimicrobium sp.]|nr:PAS domain-containing protein [Longimicrobium sp.]
MSPTPEARNRDHDAQFGRARDGIAVLSPDWRFLYANASLLEILNLLGGRQGVETFWDAIPGWADVPEAGEVRRAMETRVPVIFRFDRRPEVPHVWEVAAEPLEAGDLRVRLRNVTAQAEMEELERRVREAHSSLAERERRLGEIVSGAPVALALVDAETMTVLEANDAYAQLLDAPWSAPGAIVGHTIAEILPAFDESGVGRMLERVRDTGRPFESDQFEYHGFDRGPAWFRLTIKPIAGDEGEGIRSLLILAVEVTALVQGRHRVEAERRALYDVLNTLPMGVVVAEAPSGRITYINPTAVALSGRTSDDLSGGDAREYVARWQIFRPTGEPFAPREVPLARALAGEATREMELVLRLPDGSERTVLASGVPLRDAAGRVERGMVA